MSYEMRWYMIAFWILLILPAFRFALAAPVTIGEMLEVGSNEDAPKGGIATWEKHMNTDDEDMDGSTNEPYRNNKYNKPGNDFEPDDKSGSMLGSELSWDSEQMESDARGPDPYYVQSADEDDSTYLEDDTDDDNGNGGHDGDNGKNGGHDSDNGGHVDDSSGYDGDNDESPHNEHNAYGSESTVYMSQDPESEHPATPELMTEVKKILGSLRPRPRSGAVGVAGNR
jgi:hypothetical protein